MLMVLLKEVDARTLGEKSPKSFFFEAVLVGIAECEALLMQDADVFTDGIHSRFLPKLHTEIEVLLIPYFGMLHAVGDANGSCYTDVIQLFEDVDVLLLEVVACFLLQLDAMLVMLPTPVVRVINLAVFDLQFCVVLFDAVNGVDFLRPFLVLECEIHHFEHRLAGRFLLFNESLDVLCVFSWG